MFSMALGTFGQMAGAGGGTTSVSSAATGDVTVGGLTFAPKGRDNAAVVVAVVAVVAAVVLVMSQR